MLVSGEVRLQLFRSESDQPAGPHHHAQQDERARVRPRRQSEEVRRQAANAQGSRLRRRAEHSEFTRVEPQHAQRHSEQLESRSAARDGLADDVRPGRHQHNHRRVQKVQDTLLGDRPRRRGSHLQEAVRRAAWHLLGHTRRAALARHLPACCLSATQ